MEPVQNRSGQNSHDVAASLTGRSCKQIAHVNVGGIFRAGENDKDPSEMDLRRKDILERF